MCFVRVALSTQSDNFSHSPAMTSLYLWIFVRQWKPQVLRCQDLKPLLRLVIIHRMASSLSINSNHKKSLNSRRIVASLATHPAFEFQIKSGARTLQGGAEGHSWPLHNIPCWPRRSGRATLPLNQHLSHGKSLHWLLLQIFFQWPSI